MAGVRGRVRDVLGGFCGEDGEAGGREEGRGWMVGDGGEKTASYI